MPKVWPQATIRELLAIADATGESIATLGSEREAELFRFAIYSFRRMTGIGDNLSITLDRTKVVVTRRTTPTVTIMQGQEAS